MLMLMNLEHELVITMTIYNIWLLRHIGILDAQNHIYYPLFKTLRSILMYQK